MNQTFTNVRTVSEIIKDRTYTSEDNVVYPQRFKLLAPDQQRDVIIQLDAFSLPIRQSILDEWNRRCHNNTVRAPAAYLFGMIKKARANEFRPKVE